VKRSQRGKEMAVDDNGLKKETKEGGGGRVFLG